MRAVQRTGVESEGPNPVAADPAANLLREILEPAPQRPIQVERPALPSAPASALARPAPTKQKKAADELAAMILDDLNKIEGCPKRGVKVVVYGSNPWNSWLSFGGDAGPVPNKADLQGFCEIITERLKRRYDV
jgi:hypothetical protein